MKIAPSILSADFTQLGEQIAQCEAAGADWIHVDVMDGHFVPNITLGPVIVAAARRATSLPLDVHLMITAPERHLEAFAQAGADHLTVHAEACPDVRQTLEQIRRLGKRAGLALRPDTPAEAALPALDLADILLPMTVQPGYSGQVFMPEVLPKIQQLRDWLEARGLPAEIEVDGGITRKTAPEAQAAGATVFVAASAVFANKHGIIAGIHGLANALTAA